MHKFFRTRDGKEMKARPLPSYFYLNWPERKAEWRSSDRAPPKKNIVFKESIKWRDLNNQSVTICTNFKSDDALPEPFTYTDNPYNNVSFLKSHLQKAVRRSDVWRTLKTCYHFMDLDLQGFLRRLCVIAVEDSLPIEGYSVLMWFTAATSKGYTMTEAQKCWCVGYAMKLAECQYYETHQTEEHTEFPLVKRKLYLLPDEQQDLIYSLQFRKAYGGMRGDKKMFDNISERWYKRREKFREYLACKIPFVTPPEDKMELSEWILPAIDFHCCPQIISNLLDKFEKFDEITLRKAIWHYSSSITNKTLLPDSELTKPEKPPELKHVWTKISKQFSGLARFYLKIQH